MYSIISLRDYCASKAHVLCALVVSQQRRKEKIASLDLSLVIGISTQGLGHNMKALITMHLPSAAIAGAFNTTRGVPIGILLIGGLSSRPYYADGYPRS